MVLGWVTGLLLDVVEISLSMVTEGALEETVSFTNKVEVGLSVS